MVRFADCYELLFFKRYMYILVAFCTKSQHLLWLNIIMLK